MNTYLCIAGLLCIVLACVHSVLGEHRIFRTKRKKGKLVPAKGHSALKAGHLRIIWATWHLSSVLGGCLGALLVTLSYQPDELNTAFAAIFLTCISWAMFIGSLLVLIGTKGKHPGWIVLLLIAILVQLATL